MTYWRDTMVDQPETHGSAYVTGWTISGLAVSPPLLRSGFSASSRTFGSPITIHRQGARRGTGLLADRPCCGACQLMQRRCRPTVQEHNLTFLCVFFFPIQCCKNIIGETDSVC